MSPSGSKLNALGAYLLISLLFVFGVMVELASVLFYKQKMESYLRPPKKLDMAQDIDEMQSSNRTKHGYLKRRKIGTNKRNIEPTARMDSQYQIQKTTTVTTKIDNMAFILFAVSYSFFNLIYFSVFLTK